ncbi:hypothetical protein BJX61DRAFT_267095 [Aspergillus egyptiacus]|nr:hypothetical protein BJX61DRAFT_267095 [Aspergillus egyptiacus]
MSAVPSDASIVLTDADETVRVNLDIFKRYFSSSPEDLFDLIRETQKKQQARISELEENRYLISEIISMQYRIRELEAKLAVRMSPNEAQRLIECNRNLCAEKSDLINQLSELNKKFAVLRHEPVSRRVLDTQEQDLRRATTEQRLYYVEERIRVLSACVGEIMYSLRDHKRLHEDYSKVKRTVQDVETQIRILQARCEVPKEGTTIDEHLLSRISQMVSQKVAAELRRLQYSGSRLEHPRVQESEMQAEDCLMDSLYLDFTLELDDAEKQIPGRDTATSPAPGVQKRNISTPTGDTGPASPGQKAGEPNSNSTSVAAERPQKPPRQTLDHRRSQAASFISNFYATADKTMRTAEPDESITRSIHILKMREGQRFLEFFYEGGARGLR